jgi:expansin (peptidoglycan-binding protein)
MFLRSSLFKSVLIATALFEACSAHASLIAYYTFEGNANDVTGNGHNGSVSGATITTNGLQGSAFSFDGINDFIEIASLNINPSALPSLTMGAWVNADANDAIRQVI